MPIADLLGGRFDMQLLAKLTASAAAILLVTWVFRFYSSRARGETETKKRLPTLKNTQPSTETCSPCKTVLEPHKEREAEEYDGENQSRQSSVDCGQGTFQLQKADAMAQKKENKEVLPTTEGRSFLISGAKCNSEVHTEPKNDVTGAKGSSFAFLFGLECAGDTKSEDNLTNTKRGFSQSSGNIEDTTSKDTVTKRKKSSFAFLFGVEPDINGDSNSEDVTNAEGSSLNFSGVKSNIELDTKYEDIPANSNLNVDPKPKDVVPEKRGGSFAFLFGLDAETEMDKKSDIVTNTEESLLPLSAPERNIKDCEKTEDLVTNPERKFSGSSGAEQNMDIFRDKAEREVNYCKKGLSLPLPGLEVKPATIQSGRRSPCQLKKLDGGVEIGRELRQNMGHPGTFSSFQSKAEIKVENADLVMEGPGNRSTAVRGKIYDYFVETSSQSVSDLSPTKSLSQTYTPYEANTLPSVKDKPRTPSPLPSSLIIRDLEFSNDSDRVSKVPVGSETGRFLRHGLIRKDSYLAAAAESELHIPFPPPVTRSRSPAFQNECATNVPKLPKEIQEVCWKSDEDPQVETVARAQFFHLPVENIGNSELESLTGKIDLGNCLEALMLGKKRGHNALQQAALRVMSDNYFQVLRDPNLYGRLKAGERDQIQRQRRRGRMCLMVADMDSPDWSRSLSQSADSYTVRESSGMYYYDDFKDSWHLQCQIPKEVLSKGCAMCTMDNYLFVAVGFQWTVPSKKVFCFNPMTSIWSEICPLNEARPHCKLVALQDHVYAIGGECLSTVECYDPRTNRWSFVAPLPNETFAVAHRATACNGELFVSGGTLKYTLLRYNPKTDVWRQSLIVGSKERTTEMVAVRNFLYRFDVNPYLGISVYRYHVMARLWYECSSKQISHCPAFQCVAMDDVIYCVSRQFTMRFLADEKSPGFVADDLQILTAAKGILFPFVLALPDKSTLQTSV